MSDPELDPTRVDQAAVSPDATVVGGPPPTGRMPVGGDVPPPPDRRPWVIAAVLALIVIVLILILLLQDDDDDDVDTAASTTTTELTSTTSTTEPDGTSTTADDTTTTTEDDTPTVTVPPEECAEAGEGEQKVGLAAQTVFEAWVRGDQACAAELMTAPALTELFSRDGTGAQDELQGCTEADQPDLDADCTFTYEGGATHYLMDFSDSDGWKVTDVEQVAD